MYREVFNQLGAFTALRFTGTGALLAAERMRIRPMTLTFVDRSQEVLKMLSLYTQTFLAPAEEILIYLMKMHCRTI
jgi:hypothetical protein